jgi:hypothetical protein
MAESGTFLEIGSRALPKANDTYAIYGLLVMPEVKDCPDN